MAARREGRRRPKLEVVDGPSRRRSPTTTSNFGAGRRENHDASAFYERFPAPTFSEDDELGTCAVADQLFVGDSRDMSQLDDACVALMVTSPPYFAGKQYEEALGEGHIPGTYVEFLAMLRDVLGETYRVLEPGGRIAVNVANLGRRPFRSLAADVMRIVQDDLGYLPRGEIVWQKADGAAGSCAWGSFQSASNPVLRDVTERVIVASKGRLDRAVPRPERKRMGLPYRDTISKEEFMAATLDVWRIQPERATRVGHPAPFPVELPRRLIELHTYVGDVVLDPFVGSGTAAVAAARCGRHYVGYDTDPTYISLARERIAQESAAGPSPGEETPETRAEPRSS